MAGWVGLSMGALHTSCLRVASRLTVDSKRRLEYPVSLGWYQPGLEGVQKALCLLSQPSQPTVGSGLMGTGLPEEKRDMGEGEPAIVSKLIPPSNSTARGLSEGAQTVSPVTRSALASPWALGLCFFHSCKVQNGAEKWSPSVRCLVPCLSWRLSPRGLILLRRMREALGAAAGLISTRVTHCLWAYGQGCE